MEMAKGFAELVALVLVICAVVTAVYFAAKWLFFWEPTLAVILGCIFLFLLLAATA